MQICFCLRRSRPSDNFGWLGTYFLCFTSDHVSMWHIILSQNGALCISLIKQGLSKYRTHAHGGRFNMLVQRLLKRCPIQMWVGERGDCFEFNSGSCEWSCSCVEAVDHAVWRGWIMLSAQKGSDYRPQRHKLVGKESERNRRCQNGNKGHLALRGANNKSICLVPGLLLAE